MSNIEVNMLHIYTDGSCKKPKKEGGWYFVILDDEEEIFHEAGRIEECTTSQEMEILALKEALSYMSTIEKDIYKIHLYTDSMYALKGVTQWIYKWKKNDWKNSRGETVAHVEHWKEIYKNLNNHKYIFKKVKSHAGNRWNEYVDVKAKQQWKKK